MITVQHLTRRFGRLTAIDDLSFTVEKGEVVGFLGPNGAGKSTTMRILTGFLPATSGAARVAGFDVLRESMQVRRRIGYLPESVPLYGEHRVREMLDFQGRLHGLSRAERKARIPAVLERVGVANRSEQLVGTLSRGLRQRVGLAVALLPDPEVLILDEPTSGLDPLQRVEIRELLKGLAEDHTVLLSSHILPEVEAVCPRVIILHRGRIAAQGAQEEILAQLGRGAHVRLEAITPDVVEAQRLLAAIPGAERVRERGRLGIHHVYEITADEDLREDVGALAAMKGWALRELSWSRPTLEELFARVALELDEDQEVPGAPAATSSPSAAPASSSDASGLALHPVSDAPSDDGSSKATAHTAHVLNPFEPPPTGGGGGATPSGTPRSNVLNPFETGPRSDPGEDEK